ncbi:unnamed protein product [Blepharisma stoltei]|uniref:Uncharacterized protein n=1 Tax=Blepharisma stoltei TaxID=1481888 RepID=A0AAU9I9Y8_9CILI|nr:unnamed protein product [Blepharisma stoltei]
MSTSKEIYIANLFLYCQLHSSVIKHKKMTFVINHIGSSQKRQRKATIQVVSRYEPKSSGYYINLEIFKVMLKIIQMSPALADNSQEIGKILQYLQQISAQNIINDFIQLCNDFTNDVREVKIPVNSSQSSVKDQHMDVDQTYGKEDAEENAKTRCSEGTLQENSRPSSLELNIQAGNWYLEEEKNSSQNNKLPPLIEEDFSMVKICIYKSVKTNFGDYIDKSALWISMKRRKKEINLSKEVDYFLPKDSSPIDLCSIIITAKLKIKYKDASTRDSEGSESVQLERIKVGAILDDLLNKGIIRKIYGEEAFQIQNLKNFEDEVKGLSWRV